MRVEEALKFGQRVLVGKNSARIESEILLMYLLGFSREKLFVEHDRALSRRDEIKFKRFLSLLKRNYPIAYITSEKEFYGEKFFVDKNVLIPRPETELLVENAITLVKWFDKQRVRIVDIGAGSGCIGISIARECPNVFVIGCDISARALKIARKNSKKFRLNQRVKFIRTSLLNKLIDQKFDIIVANLPYIGIEKYNFIDENVWRYEPHKALYAGKDGLLLYRKFFKQIIMMRHKPKFVIGEFGFGQGDEICSLVNKYFVQKLGAKYEIKKDYAGIERVFIITL